MNNFSPREVRRIITTHEWLLSEINKIQRSRTELENQIKKAVDALAASQPENSGLARLRTGSDASANMRSLAGLVCRYIELEPFYKNIDQLDTQNRHRIRYAVKEAETLSGSIKRLFSSASAKQKATASCTYLQSLLDSEYENEIRYASASIFTVYDASGSKSPQGEDDIRAYEKAIDRIYPGKLYPSDYPEGVPQLLEIIEAMLVDLQKFAESHSSFIEAVSEAAKKLQYNDCIKKLAALPVEELNRDRLGIRTSLLRDSGLNTIADICYQSNSQISSIRGISSDGAFQIRNLAVAIAEDTLKTCKIRLSADDKRNEAIELIRAIAAWLEYDEAYLVYSSFFSSKLKSLSDAVNSVKMILPATKWLTLDEFNKSQAKKAIGVLRSYTTDDYISKANLIRQHLNSAQFMRPEAAKQRFISDPIIFSTALEKLVPEVCEVDDAFFGLPEELAKEIEEQCYFPDGLKCTLRRYQEWGVKYILHQERVLLGDEMGLGKTIQAIATMVSLRNTGATHFIVVCPASVLSNWVKEIGKHSKLRAIQIYGPTRYSALREWEKMGGVAVTTYETTAYIEFDAKFRYSMLVVDEAHYVKNPEANRTINVKRLSQHAERMLFMTGTPLENNVDEMVALIDMLQPRVAASVKNLSRISDAAKFRNKIASVYYRRKRIDVIKELPELIENEEWCRMGAEEEQVYERAVLGKRYSDARRVSWSVCDWHKSCKATRLKEIVEEAKAEGRKVLVFSFFLDTISMVCEMFGSNAMPPINGSIEPAKRQEIIDQFEKSPAGTVLPAQIQSGGTGLNIQSASVVVICEPQLKPSIENQAVSRAYRLGQSRNVLVYRLLCENTIDEKLMQLLNEKQKLFDAFADESVAARESMEIDEKAFGSIIREEIDRINKKNGSKSPAQSSGKSDENSGHEIPPFKPEFTHIKANAAARRAPVSSAQTQVASNTRSIVAPGLTDMLLAHRVRYEDLRSNGGTVWIYDSPEFSACREMIEQQCGCKFTFAEHGSVATGRVKSWFLNIPI